MELKLKEVRNGKEENYILPFFWQHGESRELLCEGMERIHESGIGAVCVESRPHPDFLGEGWWKDLDVIMEKAKELGMRVWVLDDAHFPSGFCGGKITEDSPYGKTYLTHYGIDVVGPRSGCSFMVNLEPGEKLVGVVIGKRDPKDPFHITEVTDITADVADGRVFADIPDGLWCVNVMKTTRKGTGRKNYISTIDRDAVRFFIDTVYEAHYEHYQEEFGKTFAGFFSDEPEIGNCLGEYGHDASIGKPDMKLPWSRTVEAELRKKWGTAFACNLMSLWLNTDSNPQKSNKTGLLRAQFMELISKLYGENFCTQIGDWCRAHQAEYIGHVIEDGGSHAHLGLGTGHFFRALWGQDMSGIDVVLQQIRPQLDQIRFHSIGGSIGYHGEFFHYGLAKLGASLGHLDPKKKGRTMCEVFGAYGWSEGLKLMKWLLDHMLVNGVNYFVPHAFTMKDFPDPDCPPHFYARGMNPQFPYFKYLMKYCNRVSHLISGGRHVPCAALLYTAEQEWMGEFIPFETAGREMTTAQIDFEVLPGEYLLSVAVENGFLCWGEEQVRVLVVPGSRCISAAMAAWLKQAAKNGLTIIFYGRRPDILEADGSLSSDWMLQKDESDRMMVCEKKELARLMKELGFYELQTQSEEPWLRYYHYENEEEVFWLLFNETDMSEIHTRIEWKEALPSGCCFYDAWKNETDICEQDEAGRIILDLSPGEMKILYALRNEKEDRLPGEKIRKAEKTEIKLDKPQSWRLWTKEAGEKEFRFRPGEETGDFGRKHPFFSGTMRYETMFTLTETGACTLELGQVYETAHVWVNGQESGVRVAPPYRFDIGDLVHTGENTLRIEVINTLVNRQRDFFSMTMPMEPSGLLGPVRIIM